MVRFMTSIAARVSMVLMVAVTSSWAQSYVYFDDFSTNQAEQDSYEHSAIKTELQAPGAPAYLMFTGAGAVRKLEFHEGVPDPRAYLNYLLPLGGQCPVLGGTVEFDASTIPGSLFQQLFIGITDDPNGSYGLYVVSGTQHCTFPMPAGNNMYVLFQGKGMAIDNLRITTNCESPVPVESASWGQIKGLYR